MLLGGLLPLLLAACSQKGPDGLARDDIRETFRRFQAAVVAGDADAAAAVTSQSTIRHYGRLRDAALTADREALLKLPIATRFEVLLLRDRLTGDELQPLSAADLAHLSLDRGWVNTDLIGRIRLGTIILKGDGAEAVIADESTVTRQRLLFFREEGAWKFDFAATNLFLRRAFERKLDDEGLTADQALFESLSQLTQRPYHSLWEPLLPAAAATSTAAPSGDASPVDG